MHALVDALDRHGLGRDLDALRLEQDLAGELRDFGRHGGGEQQRLPLVGQHRHDLAHVVDEAHVEHAVGFVEDQKFGVAQIDMALIA